jgi:hypothetical protein
MDQLDQLQARLEAAADSILRDDPLLPPDEVWYLFHEVFRVFTGSALGLAATGPEVEIAQHLQAIGQEAYQTSALWALELGPSQRIRDLSSADMRRYALVIRQLTGGVAWNALVPTAVASSAPNGA